MHLTSSFRGFVLAALCSTLPGLAAAVGPHQASGWFSVDGERVPVVSAYGWQKPHLFDRSKQETIVMLATVPFDHAELDRYLGIGFEPAAMVRRAGGEAITLSIEPDGRIFAAMPTRIERAAGSGPRVPAELVPRAGGMIGKAATSEPMLVSDLGSTDSDARPTERKIAFDVHFNISLVERKPSGAPLPPGGGEPGAIYLQLHAARLADDIEQAASLLTPFKAADMREQLADPEMAPMLARMRTMGPKSARIVAGTAGADDAYLTVGGELGDGSPYTGQVRLQRLAEGWRVAEESMQAGGG